MGKIVGSGLLSHAPVIMFPEHMRIEANGGKDFTLATGLKKLRNEVIDQVEHDTVIVLDSHWETTTEFVVSSHEIRSGKFTSSEMPMLLKQYPYEFTGDPKLARAICLETSNQEQWAVGVDDPHLPIQYATLNLQSYLQKPEQSWISISICQTATVEDFLKFGEVIAKAVEESDRRVLLIASGGLSHKFHPLLKLRAHMAGDSKNIVSESAKEADLKRVQWLLEGDHKKVIDEMPEYEQFGPEAGFGHYLTMVGAIGGRACQKKAIAYSEYESGIGTGHIHLWF